MRIRREQLQRIVADSREMLRLAIRWLVGQEHPSVVAGVPDDLLDEMIGNALAAANGYGLQAPQDLAAFVLWCFEFGPEFHRHPAIQAVLADPGVAPGDKVEAVIERVPEEAWRACEAAIHRMTWFPELRTDDG